MNATQSTFAEVVNGDYTRQHLMGLIGLTESEANRWTDRGIVPTKKSSSGTGKAKVFSFGDLVEAAIAKKMSILFKVSQIKEIMDQLRNDNIYSLFRISILNHEKLISNDYVITIYYDESENLQILTGQMSLGVDHDISDISCSLNISIIAHKTYNTLVGLDTDASNESIREHINSIIEARGFLTGIELADKHGFFNMGNEDMQKKALEHIARGGSPCNIKKGNQ